MSESAPVPPISEIAEDLAWRAHDARELGRIAAKELAAARANAEDNVQDAETLETIEVLQNDYADLVEEFNQSSTMAACIFGPEWGRYRELALGPNHQPDYEAYGGAYGVSKQLAMHLTLPMVELVDIYKQRDVHQLEIVQIQQGLTEQGLYTLADVLMRGTEGFSGAGSLPGFNAMYRTVARIDREFEWPRNASMALTAKICRTPSEVPAHVFGKVCAKLDIGVLTQARSLQDLLTASTADLEGLMRDFNPAAPAYMVEKAVRTLQKRTDMFARDFLIERRKLLRRLAQQ